MIPLVWLKQHQLHRQEASSGYKRHKDGIITLPYTETAYIENPYASDSFDVNPYKVAPFTGEMTLIPYSDDWNDVTRSDVIVDDDNNFDVINRLAEEMGVTGTVWNSGRIHGLVKEFGQEQNLGVNFTTGNNQVFLTLLQHQLEELVHNK